MKRILARFISIIVLSSTAIVSAQEIASEGDIITGARALGMGGAQIAGASDLTAVFSNPAALSRLTIPEIQIGFMMLDNRMSSNLSTSLANLAGSSEDNFTGPGTIGFAYPVPTDRGSLVLAAGYNRAKDFTGQFFLSGYDDEAFGYDELGMWGGHSTVEQMESGGMGIYSLAGAIDMSPTFALGLSLDIWRGKYNMDRRFLRNDTDGQVSWLDMTGGEDKVSGATFKPSALFFVPGLRIGAFARLPMTLTIDQRNYEQYYSRNDGGYFSLHQSLNPITDAAFLDDATSSTVRYKITTPWQYGVGISLGTPGKNSIAADVIQENWRDAKLSSNVNDPFFFTSKYRPTLSWRVGVEKEIRAFSSVLRAGYMQQPYSFKGPRGNSAADPYIIVLEEREWLTLGFTTKLDESLSLDFGFARGRGSTQEGARIDKERGNRFYATLSYRMLPYTW